MKFNKLGVMVAGALLMGSLSTQVMAAKNADVTFSARLVAATCDISASQDRVDLGTYATTDVQNINQAVSEKDFNLVLNNCTKIGKPAEGEDPAVTVSNIELLASGNGLVGNEQLFASAGATQAGIKLTAMNSVVLKPNESTELQNLKAEGEGNLIIPMKAGLFATETGDSLKAQDINVPVTFSVAYN